MLTRWLAAVAAAALLLPGTLLLPAALPLPGGQARADQIRDEVWPVLLSLDVPRAWAVTKGRGVTVAVLDSGVDAAQADLAGSVTTGPDYTQGANPPGVEAKRLHGTNMASIIAGHGHGPGGSDGVLGVAPEARLLALRVIMENDEPGFGLFNGSKRFEGTIAKGIRYAVDQGVDVINLSLGRTTPTREERQAVAYAISRNVVVVAAAGNEGASEKARRSGHAPYSYPASFPGVISVAAVNASGRHAGFSNRNSAVVVSAPGVRIIGAGPGDQYWVGDGTSPATAFVSGVAALIRSRFPRLAPALVTQAIVAGTAHRPSGGYDSGVGFGQVNATAAVTAAARLAGARADGLGLAPDRRFALTGPGPIRIIHRDGALLATYAVTAALAALILVAAIIYLSTRRAGQDDAGGS